jgi:hypothetical protein
MRLERRATLKININSDPEPGGAGYKWLTFWEDAPVHSVSGASIKNIRLEQEEHFRTEQEFHVPVNRDIGLYPGARAKNRLVLLVLHGAAPLGDNGFIGYIASINMRYAVFLGNEFDGDLADYV